MKYILHKNSGQIEMEVALCKNMDVSLEWKAWCKLCLGDQLLASGLDFSH